MISVRLGWVVGLNPIVRLWDLWPEGGMPSVGTLLMSPSPHLWNFQKNIAENSKRLG